MHLLLDGTRCKLAGWGSVSANASNPKFEHDLRELKNEPVMKSNQCVIRTYFQDVNPKGKIYSMLSAKELLELQYQLRKKFQFCIDLKKGPPRGSGPVRELY